MLICIIISVNDMKRVERKTSEIKTKTIDSTHKNMPHAINTGKQQLDKRIAKKEQKKDLLR